MLLIVLIFGILEKHEGFLILLTLSKILLIQTT